MNYFAIERRLVNQMHRLEMNLIETEMLNFVYWNDRWPVRIIFCDTSKGPPTEGEHKDNEWHLLPATAGAPMKRYFSLI